jgi:hypothetical protein
MKEAVAKGNRSKITEETSNVSMAVDANPLFDAKIWASETTSRTDHSMYFLVFGCGRNKINQLGRALDNETLEGERKQRLRSK